MKPFAGEASSAMMLYGIAEGLRPGAQPSGGLREECSSLALLWRPVLPDTSASSSGRMAGCATADVLDHAHAIASASRHAPILPVRYGWLRGDRDGVLGAWVRRHAAAIHDLLRLVSGCTEFEVAVVVRTDSKPSPSTEQPCDEGRASSGREYLERLGERRRSCAVRSARVRAALAPLSELASAEKVGTGFQPAPSVRARGCNGSAARSAEEVVYHAVFLAPHQNAHEFRLRAEFVAATLDDGERLILRGPRPPYGFSALALHSPVASSHPHEEPLLGQHDFSPANV
jgi:hypothetical protein